MGVRASVPPYAYARGVVWVGGGGGQMDLEPVATRPLSVEPVTVCVWFVAAI